MTYEKALAFIPELKARLDATIKYLSDISKTDEKARKLGVTLSAPAKHPKTSPPTNEVPHDQPHAQPAA